MSGLIKELGSTQPCQPRAAGSKVRRAGNNYSRRNVTQTAVKRSDKVSAYAGLQLVCGEVVDKSFPLNVFSKKWSF